MRFTKARRIIYWLLIIIFILFMYFLIFSDIGLEDYIEPKNEVSHLVTTSSGGMNK